MHLPLLFFDAFFICSRRGLGYLSTESLLGQRPGRWFRDRFSNHPSRLKFCPDGRVGLGQGLLVAHPPGRAILKVGHAGDEAAILLAPEYLYCVSIFRFSHRATSFAQTPAGCSTPTLINIGKLKSRQGQSAEKLKYRLMSLNLYRFVSLLSTNRLIEDPLRCRSLSGTYAPYSPQEKGQEKPRCC